MTISDLLAWVTQGGAGVALAVELLAVRTAASGRIGWVPAQLAGAARRAIVGTEATAAEGDALLAALRVSAAQIIFLAMTGSVLAPIVR